MQFQPLTNRRASSARRGVLQLIALGFFVLALVIQVTPAMAVPTLLVDGSGILQGADGVTVGSSLYNVRFKDGSCNSLFNSCNPTAFAFHDSIAAYAVSRAWGIL